LGELLKTGTIFRMTVHEHRPGVHPPRSHADMFWKFIGQLIQGFNPLINIPSETIRNILR
jgi:hypothetical protein